MGDEENTNLFPYVDFTPGPPVTFTTDIFKYEPYTYRSSDGMIHFQMRKERKEEKKMGFVKFKDNIDIEDLKIYEGACSKIYDEIGNDYRLYINHGNSLIPKSIIEKEISEDEYMSFYNDGHKIDDRTDTDFRRGDKVRIRSYNSMAKNFHTRSDGTICTGYVFVPEMHYMLEKEAIIERKSGEEVSLRFLDKNVIRKNRSHGWSFHVDMLEIVEHKQKKERKDKVVYSMEDEIVKEMLDKVDLKKIKKILSSCFQIPGKDLLGLNKMLETWAINKRDLYLIFGKNFRISKDIEFEADDSMVREKISQLCDKYPVAITILKDLTSNELKVNKLSIDTSNLDMVAKHITGCRNGMKFTTFLSKALNNKDFDTDFSKIIDETKVKGQITISIDPIDYLLMSINKSGWQSCHSLHEGPGRNFGCYSAGVFSYMCDNSTAISYRHSNDEVEYNINGTRFKEYSKNWRQCIYIDSSNGNFVTSRQYPRKDETIAKNVRELLEETVSEYFKYNNQWKVSRNRSLIREHMKDYCMDDRYWNGDSGALHYNDIWHGYDGAIIYNKDIDNLEDTDINVGNDVICPICGKHELEEPGHPACYRCL